MIALYHLCVSSGMIFPVIRSDPGAFFSVDSCMVKFLISLIVKLLMGKSNCYGAPRYIHWFFPSAVIVSPVYGWKMVVKFFWKASAIFCSSWPTSVFFLIGRGICCGGPLRYLVEIILVLTNSMTLNNFCLVDFLFVIVAYSNPCCFVEFLSVVICWILLSPESPFFWYFLFYSYDKVMSGAFVLT